MTKALLVTPDVRRQSTMEAVVERCVEDARNIEVHSANAYESAVQLLDVANGSFDLVITDLNIPSKADGDWSGEFGLQLGKRPDVAGKCIVTYPAFAPRDHNRLWGEFRKASIEAVVYEVGSFLEDLEERIVAVLENLRRSNRLTIDINISAGFATTESDRRRYIKFPENGFDDLETESRNLSPASDRGNWRDSFRNIGNELNKRIIGSELHYEVFKHLERQNPRAPLERLDTTSLRFTVDPQENYDVLLESLCLNDKHWFVRGPVYRALATSAITVSGSIFDSSEDLRVLAIDAGNNSDIRFSADVSPTRQALTAKSLENPAIECYEIREAMGDGRVSVEMMSVKKLGSRDPYLDVIVRDKLQGEEWDIVHFAGHTVFSEHDRVGYLLFPDADGYGKWITVQDFSAWVSSAGADFVFLSSCNSYQAKIVVALVEQGVQAVLGYRWDVDDQPARDFALRFYGELASDRSLEWACYNARKSVRQDYFDHEIWAAPMLVVQS